MEEIVKVGIAFVGMLSLLKGLRMVVEKGIINPVRDNKVPVNVMVLLILALIASSGTPGVCFMLGSWVGVVILSVIFPERVYIMWIPESITRCMFRVSRVIHKILFEEL